MTDRPGSSPAVSPPMIRVEFIWLAGDWPEEPPLRSDQGASTSLPAYALPAVAGRQQRDPVLVSTVVPTLPGSAVADLLARWLTPAAHQAIAARRIDLAIHGQRIRAGQRLREGDRIELLAGIQADPRSDRRARVRAERQQAGRDKWRTGAGAEPLV